MVYAVVMAGGKGTRLWPQSRENMPKQLWEIFDGKSMLQDTIERVAPIILPEQVLVITGEHLYQAICEQLPQVPPKNIIVEPMGRSTAPCVGLAALYAKHPDACMVILPSDHLIRNVPEFQRVLRLAIDVASQGENLVTFGITPSTPETGFGYIQRGEKTQAGVYAVRKFTEKPDLTTARYFVNSGEYYWNSGMFVWKVSTILTVIERYMPKLYHGLLRIDAALGTPQEQHVIAEVFDGLEAISVDYGIMEKAENTFVIPGDFRWSDVGSWAALPDVWQTNQEGNTCRGQVMTLDSAGNIVYDDSGLTALIGVEQMIVVRVRNTVLVCHRDQAQRVKEIVDELERKGLTDYL